MAAQHQASGLALEVSKHSPGWDLAGVLKNLYRVGGGGAPVVWGQEWGFPTLFSQALAGSGNIF